jgi:hypothetical protein
LADSNRHKRICSGEISHKKYINIWHYNGKSSIAKSHTKKSTNRAKPLSDMAYSANRSGNLLPLPPLFGASQTAHASLY